MSFFRCDECGEISDDRVVIEGYSYCTNCESFAFECAACGSRYLDDYYECDVNGESWCEDCFEDL